VRFVGYEGARARSGPGAAEDAAAPPSTRAFRIAGGSRGGALLVHGFTGTPHEMLPLAEPLARAGFDVLGVRLPGHGAAEPDEPNEWSAWRDTVAAGLAELESSGAGSVVVVGLSMGALLAIELAHASTRVGAIVALSPAITLPLAARMLLRAGSLTSARLRRRLLPTGQSDIRDVDVRARHPKSAPFPVAAALSFNALRLGVRTRVRSVAQPMLIVHSRLDRTCPIAGAHWLARSATAAEVEMHVLDRSGHVIPVDHEAEAATRLVLDFVERRMPVATRRAVAGDAQGRDRGER
jgi:carboxylesterase